MFTREMEALECTVDVDPMDISTATGFASEPCNEDLFCDNMVLQNELR